MIPQRENPFTFDICWEHSPLEDIPLPPIFSIFGCWLNTNRPSFDFGLSLFGNASLTLEEQLAFLWYLLSPAFLLGSFVGTLSFGSALGVLLRRSRLRCRKIHTWGISKAKSIVALPESTRRNQRRVVHLRHIRFQSTSRDKHKNGNNR
ncbi:hypothetical protein Micbo1qcDRAFT_20859 [Microdochium bolleyi]|uniref:Uncharacterized protein n=1 Tax=Microdochium bolleyi TaxID=196109 RepID=A0A136IS66_9PEZI|nr:hypothetical protein Micbo1qcDRAFT_20859 [Microdochium bolleyi]